MLITANRNRTLANPLWADCSTNLGTPTTVTRRLSPLPEPDEDGLLVRSST